MNLERGLRRVTLVFSIALAGTGVVLTGYESYLTARYVSIYQRWMSAQDRVITCLETTRAAADRVVEPARAWMQRRAHLHRREIENLVRFRVEDFGKGLLEGSALDRRALQRVETLLEQRDLDFKASTADVRRLIAVALIETHRYTHKSDAKSEEERWKGWARLAVWDDEGECFGLTKLYRSPSIEEAGRLAAFWDFVLVRWDWAWPIIEGRSYNLLALPIASGLALTAALSALPWGLFYLVRWIVRGFRG